MYCPFGALFVRNNRKEYNIKNPDSKVESGFWFLMRLGYLLITSFFVTDCFPILTFTK